MKQFNLVLMGICFLFYANLLNAQAPPPSSFGGFYPIEHNAHEEISETQRKAIIKELQASTASLKARGLIKEAKENGTNATKFIHPLRQAAGFNDPGFYGISGYVDHLATTGIRDYNCGTRTYNGHMGTDYFTFPFGWQKMDANAVEIIAAADGVIIAKGDGRPDKNCAMCTDSSPADCWLWNAVYVRNTDGTVSWYGHMKTGTLTTKPVGATVTQGEYLGVVGSSGSSSGPHLHFEVWKDDTYTTLIDPWKTGTCNPTATETFWDAQEAYYYPMVNKVSTASGIPSVYTCYENGNGEKPLYKNTFNIGETVYFPVYVRDNRPGTPGFGLKITKPSGQVLFQWTLAPFNVYYPSAFFYYFYDATYINIPGEWKFTASYGSNEVEHTFTMVAVLPVQLIDFTANKKSKEVLLEWNTSNEQNFDHFEIERSENGETYHQIGTLRSKGDQSANVNQYSFYDHAPLYGNNFYRLKMVDKDGKVQYSDIEKIGFDAAIAVSVFPNPAGNIVTLKGVAAFKRVSITDMYGKRVLNQLLTKDSEALNISSLPQGVYTIQLSNESETKSVKLVKK